jgi:hypothetical protein
MKTLLLKLLAGCTLVAILQIPVGYALREPDVINFERIQRTLASRSEKLLFGDSVLEFSTVKEPTSLLELLEERMPLGSFSGPGYTPELQLAVLEDALHRGYVPRLVGVSVNMRCFNESWDQGLQYQFTDLRARLRFGDVVGCGIQKPLSSYQIWAWLEGFPRSEQAFKELPIRRGGRTLGTMREVIDASWNKTGPDARAKAFSLLYLYPLEAGHRKIRALVRLAAVCRSAKIPLRMYVTPLDVDTGERMTGPEFRSQVARNIDVIRRALADEGVDLVDWSSLLRADQFSYHEYPNEHLNRSGRERLAEEMVALLKTAP